MNVVHDQMYRANKAHQCNLCLGTIGVGDVYHRQRNTDGGDIWTFRAHRLCWKIESGLREPYDEENSDPSELRAEIEKFFTNLVGVGR